MKLIPILALASGLALGACQPEQPSEPPADAPAAADPATESGLALAESALAGIVATVEADTENCALMEGRERETEVVDLGGGVGAVVADCSAGMRDVWRQLYIVLKGGGHPERVPVVQYDIQGDGQWRAEFAQPNLQWNAADGVFVSEIHHPTSGCGSATTWRWDGAEARIAMVSQTVQDCEGAAQGQDLPDPRVIWPTNPATPEPQP